MTNKLQSFPGMEDILPGEIEKWQWLENRARSYFEALNFKEIRTPLLEPTELFARSIGETTDIVHKEMYTFEDRGNRSMTLRPEMTASVARSVIQHGLLKTAKSLSLYYIGPMFRAERPQAGRKRQFHQIGVELINLSGQQADVLGVMALDGFLKYLKIAKPTIRINDLSVINGERSEQIKKTLRDYFESHKARLDKDSLYRLDRNVLRIFDSKDPGTQEVVGKTPWNEIAPFSESFIQLQNQLNEKGVSFEVNRRLVRGLDYYTGVVFEATLPGLGSQDAVAGGGRYDRLYHELGGPEAPCTGFSIGFERLLMALSVNDTPLDQQVRAGALYFAVLENALPDFGKNSSTEWRLKLREAGFRVEANPALQSLGDHLKRANKLNVPFVIIIGPQEAQKDECLLKWMDTKEQKQIPMNQLISTLREETNKNL